MQEAMTSNIDNAPDFEKTNQEFDRAIARCRQVYAAKLQDYGAAWRLMRPSSVTDQARHIISPGFVPASPAQPTERDRIAEALKRHDGHRKAAAADLGISERTLYRKIREYDLE